MLLNNHSYSFHYFWAVRAQNPQEENAEEEQEEQGNKDQQEEEKQAEQEEEKQEDQDEEEREEEQKADNVLKDFEDLNLEDDKMSKMYAPQILKDEGLVSLGHHYPVLGHKSVVGYNEFYLLQFFVPGLPEENFRPRVEKNGRSLVLEMHIPALFVDSERLTWMPGDSGVDHNSVTSFRSVTAHVASIQMDERVITHSHGQVVPLPFEVERDIVDVKLVHHRVDGQRHGVNVYMVNLKGVKKLKGRLLQGEYIEIGSPQQQIQQPQRQEPQQQPQGFFERLMTPARTTQRTSNVTPH